MNSLFSKKTSPVTIGVIAAVLSALLYGFAPVLVAKANECGATGITLTFFRDAFTFPVCGLLMLIFRRSFRITKKELLFIAILGIFGRTLTTASLFSAYPYIGIGSATVIHFIYPVLIALFCRFFFREKLGILRVAALVFAFSGICFFAGNPQSFGVKGILLALLSAVTFGFCSIWLDKTGLADIDPLRLTFYLSGVIAISSIGVGYAIGSPVQFVLPGTAYFYAFIVAMLESFFATALLQIGIRHLGASLASFLSMLEPLTSTISGILLLGEEMIWQKAVGCVLVLTGVALVVLSGRKNKNVSDKEANAEG